MIAENEAEFSRQYWNMMLNVTLKERAERVSAKAKKCGKKNISKRYKLGDKFQDIYFSKREAECAAYMIRGKRSCDIAEILGLSSKTVESYIVNMREKLRSKNKYELMGKVWESDFPKFAKLIIQNNELTRRPPR